MNDPGSILSSAREKLDFSQPVAIMLMGMLALNEAVDNDQSANDALDGYNQTGAVPYRARRADQIVRFFDGLELVDPGIVQLQAWRPEPGLAGPPSVPALGGVGRKR